MCQPPLNYHHHADITTVTCRLAEKNANRISSGAKKSGFGFFLLFIRATFYAPPPPDEGSHYAMTRSVRLSVCPKLLVKTVHYGTMLLLKIDVKSFKVFFILVTFLRLKFLFIF